MSLLDNTTDIATSRWPMNAWYAAAHDVEVGRRPDARTGRAPVALTDGCWHRLVPLALGSLEGDDGQGPGSIRLSIPLSPHRHADTAQTAAVRSHEHSPDLTRTDTT